MIQSTEMMAIFERCIADYHVQDDVDQPMQNPCEEGSLENLLYAKNWIDTVQWHLEDIIREPSIEPSKALEIKRRIDRSNQQRTNKVEEIDDHIFQTFKDVKFAPDARLNTESPAWAIDRLSILALKIYHMQIEAERTDTDEALQTKNKNKLKTLKTQREDLTTAIDQLLEDMASGKRIAKVYRQMKMYNDPELNPVLYAQKP